MASVIISRRSTSRILRSLLFCISGLLIGHLFSLDVPSTQDGPLSKYRIPEINVQSRLSTLVQVSEISGPVLQKKDVAAIEVSAAPNDTTHRLLSRALNPTFVLEGSRMICNLQTRNYPTASTWTDAAAISNNIQGWTTVDLVAAKEVITSLGPWLTANSLSTTIGDYKTMKTQNIQTSNSLPNSDRLPTGAAFKHIFNFGDGTIIVEDVLGPKQAPGYAAANWDKQAIVFGGPEALSQFQRRPSTSLADYQVPSLQSLSDIMFLQILRGATEAQVKGINRLIRYHIVNPTTQNEIREALATVGKTIDDVNIDNDGAENAFIFLLDTHADACGALLKTPNGNGGYWLFAQHPTQMDSKMLSKITVFSTTVPENAQTPVGDEDATRYYYMIEEFVPAPEPE